MINIFNYISIFNKSIISFFLSFFTSFIIFKKIISWNNKKNIIGEKIRKLGISGEDKKSNTPTMGGLAIIFSTLIYTIFFSHLNIYVIILILTTLYIGIIGFIDDYIKINYKNKEKRGLNVIEKLLFQIIFGIVIGSVMYFNTNTTIQFNKKVYNEYGFNTNIPNCMNYFFLKKNFNYSCLLKLFNNKKYTWIIFIPIIAIFITFFSNGSNITDGIDGLTAGISLIILSTLSFISYIISNPYYSYYYNLIYIPEIKETIIFSLSLLGSLFSFYWYNSYPAQIFMGDTGSLTIGAIISTLAIINRVELLLPFLCIIFLLENTSVIIQILYSKYFKIKYGIKKKIFLMAPIHHHFQKLGIHENKIFIRFLMIQLMFSILTLFLLLK